jgi:hypothetical protein
VTTAVSVPRSNAKAQALLARAEAHEALARADRLEAAAAALEEENSKPSSGVPTRAVVDRSGLGLALGVSLATVDRLRLAGCPVIFVCEAPRFEVSAVLDWLRRRSVEDGQ